MKKLTALLILLIVFSSAQTANANTIDDDARLQLLAIIDYLERNYLPSTELSTAETKQVIVAGADWIVSSQKEDGSFSYEYRPFEDLYSADNNIVRQGGTFYSLAEVYRHQVDKDQDIAMAIEKAVLYFENISHEGKGNAGDFKCVKNSRTSTRCDLGTTSLVLLGLLSYIETEPSNITKYEKLAEDYFQYLMSARLEGRGFSNRYHTDDGFSDAESSFFNGETMLALVRYYQHQPSDEIRQTFDEVFEYLAGQEVLETPLYLWMMAALKDAHQVWPNEAYLAYGERFTSERLSVERYRRNSGVNYCAPLEGMVSAQTLLTDSSDTVLKQKLTEAIAFWLARVSELQLDAEQPYRLSKVDDILSMQKFDNAKLSHGGFLTAEDELKQRIDFTQHCISAFIQKQVDVDGENI